MKILFISDLHLGSPLFKSDDTIIRLLGDSSYDKIVILGDIIDTWEGTTERIVRRNKNIIKKINELSNVVIVKGNHDPSFEVLSEIFPNSYCVEHFEPHMEDDILITHGDDFDKLVTDYSFFAKMVFPVQWLFSRLGINPKAKIRNTLHSIACHREKKYYNDLVTDVEEHLVDKYKYHCKYLVAGHTHLPKLVNTGDITYVNCGDWVHNRTYAEYIDGIFTIRTEDGKDYFE